jgi:phenylpropionate dioxygenase-like ring-hydroxylating dioxygenase large terminal subunit
MSRFLHNAWYPVAFSSDIAVGASPFARTLLERPLVFFREQAGALRVLEDRCPHRFAPLSKGSVAGGRLTCPYHGLQFDGTGRCVHNPHGNGEIPKAAVVASLPVTEQNGVVWVWPGNPAQAQEGLLPDLGEIHPKNEGSTFTAYLRSEVDYEIVVDNLLDLTHADFLHPGLLSTKGAILACHPQVEELSDRCVRLTLDLPLREYPAIPTFAPFMPRPLDPAATRFQITWHAPCIIDIVVHTSQEGPHGMVTHSIQGAQLLAPEAAHSTHYHVVGSRTMDADDPSITAMVRMGALHAFAQEDGPMLKAVSERLGEQRYADLQSVLLSSDAGAVRARRAFNRLLAHEVQCRREGMMPSGS